MENLLIPLGGADNVGTSCYYVQLDGVRVLFDAGRCIVNGKSLMPDFDYLQLHHLPALSDLDCVVISHAHLDHIGAIPYLYEKTGNICYLASKETKRLVNLQLVEKGLDRANSEYLRNLSQQAIDNLCECSMGEKIYINKDKPNEACIEFFEAGHCMGAVMTKLTTRNHTLVYTGDFNFEPGLDFSDIINCDILIMSTAIGTNRSSDAIAPIMEHMNKYLALNRKITVYANNVAKYYDIISGINKNFSHKRIAIDQSMAKLVNAYNSLGYYVDNQIYTYEDAKNADIIITARPQKYKRTKINASLYSKHPELKQLYQFALSSNAKQIYLVHTDERYDSHIADMLISNTNNTADIVQCRNLMKYKIGGMYN